MRLAICNDLDAGYAPNLCKRGLKAALSGGIVLDLSKAKISPKIGFFLSPY